LREPSTPTRPAQILDRLVTNFANDYRFATFHALPLSLTSRLGYLPRKYAAIVRNQRQVRFLGKPFHYDNRLMPALLQAYPNEIAALDRHVHFGTATRVMDVGANVGQFGFVLKTFFPHLEVVSFEPNPSAFDCLRRNATQHAGWRVFPFGLAPESRARDFFVVDGKSAQGSVFPENAAVNLLRGEPSRIQVRLEHLSDEVLAAHAIPREYDFVKIDVEGFERDVLASLDRIRWRYLYLELSVTRAGSTSLDEVQALVARTTGRRPRVVFQQPIEPGTSHIDVILASE
jgi:FkbM family methyltransferase